MAKYGASPSDGAHHARSCCPLEKVSEWPHRGSARSVVETEPARVLSWARGNQQIVVALESGEELYALEPGPFENVNLSADGRRLLGWQDCELGVWDLETGKLLGRWTEDSRIRSPSMEGTRIAFAKANGEVTFLELP